jgi:hypothetical protein
MKKYRAKTGTIVFTVSFLGALTALTTFGAVFAEPRLFFVAFLGVLAWRWYLILKTPVEVRIRDDGSIEFRRLVGRSLILELHQIKQLKRVGRGVWLAHDSGSLSLYGNMRGLDELLWELRVRNPALREAGADADNARG